MIVHRQIGENYRHLGRCEGRHSAQAPAPASSYRIPTVGARCRVLNVQRRHFWAP